MLLPDGPFIFVSYSRQDGNIVYPEIKRIASQGYTIWYDKGDLIPGYPWDEYIQKAIKECSCFMVFITRTSVRSARVEDEINQALRAERPFICIYWEDVELPSGLGDTIERIQRLERYSLHTFEYEEPLNKALSQYIKKTDPLPAKKSEDIERAYFPVSSDASSGISPKVICFILILLSVFFIFFAIVAIVMPFVATLGPNDPLGNPWVGLLIAAFFVSIAASLGVAAFLVYRKFLRRKNG